MKYRTPYYLFGIMAVMAVLAIYSPTLYDLFCRVTGFSGTTQVAQAGSDRILDQEITVRFSASTMKDMPWEFKAVDNKMKVKIGETNLVFFEAYNPTDKVITGTASYNVAPFELGGYFSKIECFCFTEQTLQPGERIQMPVTFFVDPDIVDDEDTMRMQSITLAYTFHLSEEVAVLDNKKPS